MDAMLAQGIKKEETSADNTVNGQITDKGNELDAKMNKEMNEYKAKLIEEMEESLGPKKKELKEKYPTDQKAIEKELQKLREPLIKIIEEKCQIKYKKELEIIKGKMDEHLDQRVGEIHDALKGMLKNPMGAFESIIQSLVAGGIQDIEQRLLKIQDELIIPEAEQIISRLERNANFDALFKKKTKSDPTSVDPEATKKQEAPADPNVPTVGGGIGGALKKEQWKIMDEIRNEALSKVEEIKKRSIDGLRKKISQKIHCVTSIRIENMIGRDIRWPK